MLASVISRVIIHKNDSKCDAESDYTSPEFFVPNWGDRDMAYDDDDDTTTFNVVMNYEEQYSIWPVDRQLPGGWRLAGKAGSKAECLSYIDEVWTDMRPLSLRRASS
jgi:MbtH protein